MSEPAKKKTDDSIRQEKPEINIVDESKLKQQAYEQRKAEREAHRAAEKAKIKAEKLALITCIKTLIAGMEADLETLEQ